MTDYIIGVWFFGYGDDRDNKYDDLWRVTVHSSRHPNNNIAYFMKEHYGIFKTRKEADVYAEMVFYQKCRKRNRVHLVSPRKYNKDEYNRTPFGEYVSKDGRHHYPRTIDKLYMDEVVRVIKDEQEHWT